MKRKPVHPLTVFGFVIIVSYIEQINPAMGYLLGGLVLTVGAGLTWLRRDKIWKEYKKRYKKSKSSLGELLNKPRDIYYTLNVWVVLPLAFAAGIFALYYAWKLS